VKSGDQIKTRGLAGAVGADQRHGFVSCTVKLTSCTARKPPNRLLRPRMTSGFCHDLMPYARAGPSDMALPRLGHDADQPVGRHRITAIRSGCRPSTARRRSNCRASSAAVQEWFPTARCRPRPPQSPDPTDDRHQCGFNRDVETERGRGIDEVDVLGVKRAGQSVRKALIM